MLHILSYDTLNEATKSLAQSGRLKLLNENYLYLDINDDYIHHLHKRLVEQVDCDIQKPNYFSAAKNNIGAHISVIYPDEATTCSFSKIISEEVAFTIGDLFCVDIGRKCYYALSVHSEKLSAIREQCQLPNPLSFKSIPVGFHITVGIKCL